MGDADGACRGGMGAALTAGARRVALGLWQRRHLSTSQEACAGLSSFVPKERLVSCFFTSSESGIGDAKKETLKTKPIDNNPVKMPPRWAESGSLVT